MKFRREKSGTFKGRGRQSSAKIRVGQLLVGVGQKLYLRGEGVGQVQTDIKVGYLSL
jgi:hypothetical protein